MGPYGGCLRLIPDQLYGPPSWGIGLTADVIGKLWEEVSTELKHLLLMEVEVEGDGWYDG